MKITSDLFEASLKCPTKCWLRATGQPSAGTSHSRYSVCNDGSGSPAAPGTLGMQTLAGISVGCGRQGQQPTRCCRNQPHHQQELYRPTKFFSFAGQIAIVDPYQQRWRLGNDKSYFYCTRCA